MKNYCVTISPCGFVYVEADSESEAMEIADRCITSEISWSDDWEPTDAVEAEDVGVCGYSMEDGSDEEDKG